MTDIKQRQLNPSSSLSKSPGKSASTLGNRANYSPQKYSGQTSVAKINPNLIPKTYLAIQTNGQLNFNDLVPARMHSSHSNKRQDQKSNEIGSKTVFGDFRSPQHKSNHSRKISNIFSPQRAPIILTSSITESSTTLSKPTEKVIQRLIEGTQQKIEGRKIAENVLQTHSLKKEAESQVLILENRIKKLQLEEQALVKKINLTTDKTEKVLASKLRHQEDLATKSHKMKIREEELKRRKDELRREKGLIEEKVRIAQKTVFFSKHETAQEIKIENSKQKQYKINCQKEIEQKNREVVLKVHDLKDQYNQLAKLKKKENQIITRESVILKIENEKSEVEHLNQRAKELEQMEQRMLEKLSQTYSVHKSRVHELQKVYDLKVAPDSPVKESDDYDEDNEDDESPHQSQKKQ